MDIDLKRPGYVYRTDHTFRDYVKRLTGGNLDFVPGDIVALVAASQAWEKADADHDGAATTLLAVALDNPGGDIYEGPRDSDAQIQGKDLKARFRIASLSGMEVFLNVNANQDLVEADIDGAVGYGLLYDGDPDTGFLTVDLTNTTQAHFFLTGLSGEPDGGTYGDSQVRVKGYFAESRIWRPAGR